MKRKLRSILRRLWIAAGLSITAWMYAGFQATDVPESATRSDEQVTFAAGAEGLRFQPKPVSKPAGIIFLPGGMVEPTAYAPLMKRVASAGYEARLLYFPMRCACTDAQIQELFTNIRKVIAEKPGISWILGGHSRGAMLTARYAHEAGTAGLAGLALIGTTHPRDFSLADLSVPVTKIYATNDGVAPYTQMRLNAQLLPAHTKWVAIEGGNHVQFGYYRHQFGDGTATLPRAQQQEQMAQALLTQLSSVTSASAQ
ncbi:MAG: hypothetical protein J0H49_33645 [Acidobacteria bacterium]|nr:hypothetical protein [Acidobacteriota bacterium]